MGKKVAKKKRGMNLWAKVALVTLCTVLLTVFMYQGWYKPLRTEADISVLNQMPATPQVTNGTGSSRTATFTPSAGTNRIILISVHAHTNNTTATTISVDYGNGSTWTPARPIVNSPNNQRRQDWLFYLNEADIAASSGNTIRVTNTNPGSGYLAYIGTLSGVDQNPASTVIGSYQVYSPNVSYSFNVPAGAYAMFASTDNDAGNPTNTGGYTGNASVAVGSAYAYVAGRTFTTGTTTNPGFSTTASYNAFAAAAFNPAPAGDITAPTVTAFTMPATATSTTVNVSSFTVTDAVGVTGYMITESATAPAAGAAGWLATAPTTFTFAGTGARTAYAWAKDAAGNVSTSRSATVTITLPDTTAPTVDTFTMPATATSTTVNVSSFTATDAVGVTGYMITESAIAPAAGAAGWLATAPTTFTFAGTGARTAYAWAKDAAGNVSTSRSATVTVTLPDTTAPTVDTFTLPATSTSKTVSVTAYTATDNVAVTGYLVTANPAAPLASDPGWTGTAMTSFTFPSAGTVTAYAWAKDAAGNVSTGKSATVSITIPGVSPLMHGSDYLGTKYGSWGTSFTCSTCHARNTQNIKRVTASIPADIGAPLVKPVRFMNLTGFGSDGDAHITSGRICEVCHTQTTVHRYDTTGQTDFNHMGANETDCTGCHIHNAGFKGTGCNTCHGFPPVNATTGIDGLANPPTSALAAGQPGAHLAHTNPVTRGMKCTTCHDSYTLNPMGNSRIEIGFNINAANYPGFGPVGVASGTFTGNLDANMAAYGYSWSATAAGTTINQAAATSTCAVYCHGSWNGAVSNGAKAAANWVGGVAEVNSCGNCHGATAGAVPRPDLASGAHARHAGSGSGGLGLACGTCHQTYTDNTHVDGSVAWNLSAISASATYRNSNSGTTDAIAPSVVYGACNNLYCHSNVQESNGTAGATTFGAPTWGGTLGCDGCHASPMTNGSHPKHTAIYGFACTDCHSGAGSSSTRHADGTIDVAFSASYGGSYSQAANTPGNGYGTCSATYCHSKGTGGTVNPGEIRSILSVSAPAWSGTVSCGSCHGNGNVTGQPEYASGTPKANSHASHTTDCSVCHNGTTTTGTSITNAATHSNRIYDVTPKSGTTFSYSYNASGGSCSSISCHFNNTAQWGTTLTCVNCHPLAALQANGAHGKHVAQSPAFYNFTANHSLVGSYDFGCSNCHPLDNLNHANGAVNVTINKINTGSGGLVGTLRSKNNATADGLAATDGPSGIYGTTKVSVRCSASYCHSNGYAANLRYMVSPDWYGPAYTGDKCAMCHGNSPNAGDPVNQPGSPAHYSKNFLGFSNVSGGHVMGIHTNNIFNGASGLAIVGNTPTGSHGNAGTSSTINCNMCHYATVTSSANDRNKACVKCHGSLPKNPAELIADKRFHVSGYVDVAFMPVKVKSKAQLREASYDKTLWSRPAGYKTPGAYDVAFKTFTTATQWDGATKSCSNIACHNGKPVKWSETGGQTNCVSCHDTL